MPPGAPSPTTLVERFACFIKRLRQALLDGIDRQEREQDQSMYVLGPVAVLLYGYLERTFQRFEALYARFAAGKLPAPRPPRAASPGEAARRRARKARRNDECWKPGDDERAARERLWRIPRLPVLARWFYAGYFCHELARFIEEPEMRALLAAAPQAGRLLRPLWRKLTDQPFPAALRPPPSPPRAPRPDPYAQERAAAEAALAAEPEWHTARDLPDWLRRPKRGPLLSKSWKPDFSLP